MTDEQREDFEQAFAAGSSGCRIPHPQKATRGIPRKTLTHRPMTDTTLLFHVSQLGERPNAAQMVTRYRCGYAQATRVLEALREADEAYTVPKLDPLRLDAPATISAGEIAFNLTTKPIIPITKNPTPPTIPPVPICRVLEWRGCYGKSWKGIITDDSFRHPAKYSRLLVERILRHGLAEGYWRRGDTLGDPFGGVGTGGVMAAELGLRWIGNELEPRFWQFGQDNFALHSARWIRCGLPVPILTCGDSRQFDTIVAGVMSSPPYADSVNAGGHGIDWSKQKPTEHNKGRKRGAGTKIEATLVEQLSYGDEPGQIGSLKGDGLDGAMGSPPYMTRTDGCGIAKTGETTTRKLGRSILADGALLSPPYAATAASGGGLNHKPAQNDSQQSGRAAGGSQVADWQYGDEDGQIGKLAETSLDGAVLSPPWEDGAQGHIGANKWADPAAAAAMSLNGKGHTASAEARAAQFKRDSQKDYGSTRGQIGKQKGGSVDDITLGLYNNGNEPITTDMAMAGGILRGGGMRDVVRGEQELDGGTRGGNHDRAEGKETIGDDPGISGGDGISGSAPLLEEAIPKQVARDDHRMLGAANNQKTGEPIISGGDSPIPNSQGGQGETGAEERGEPAERPLSKHRHQANPEAVGCREKRKGDSRSVEGGCQKGDANPKAQRETYWQAVHQVYAAMYRCLKPGGVAALVVKDFVRKGKRVPLCDDTLRLLCFVGFEPIERAQAMLTESIHHHPEDLFDGQLDAVGSRPTSSEATQVSRKSFFRRVHEAKPGAVRIDFEEVLFVRKPVTAAVIHAIQ